MKRCILLFSFIFYCYTSICQTFNIIDGDSTVMTQVSNGHGRWWYVLKLDELPDGKYKVWFRNDTTQLKFSCTVQDHHFIDKYEEYHSNGQLEERWHYNEKGDWEGLHQSWYKNGQIETDAFYHDNKIDGTYKLWYPDGSLRQVSKFINGERDSICVLWHSKDYLQSISRYKQGKKIDEYGFTLNHLTLIRKYLNDSLFMVTSFHYKKIRNNKAVYSNIEGQTVKVGMAIKSINYYVNHKPYGQWLFFDEKGCLLKIENY